MPMPTSDKPPFSIVIPPPNVTGALHLGHALNNTLQDILCRMKRMQGFNVLWMPGTDHAGIATQAVVERRLLEEEKKSRHDLGREGLVERIWEWKEQYEKRILGQLKQLGCQLRLAADRGSRSTSMCPGGPRDFFQAVQGRQDLPRQAAGELGHVSADGRQRRRSFPRGREGPLLALPVPGDRIRSPASRRMSRSPRPAPKRCSAIRPWPCIPIRPGHFDQVEADCAKNWSRRPPKRRAALEDADRSCCWSSGPKCLPSLNNCATWPPRGGCSSCR